MSTVTTTFSAAASTDSSNCFYAFVLGLIVLVVFLFKEKHTGRVSHNDYHHAHHAHHAHHIMPSGFPRILGVIPGGLGFPGNSNNSNNSNNSDNGLNRLGDTLARCFEADLTYKTELRKKWAAEDDAIAKKYAAEDAASAAKKLAADMDVELQTAKAELAALRATLASATSVAIVPVPVPVSVPVSSTQIQGQSATSDAVSTSTSTSTATSALSAQNV
jgi:hypothetical protein